MVPQRCNYDGQSAVGTESNYEMGGRSAFVRYANPGKYNAGVSQLYSNRMSQFCFFFLNFFDF